MQEKSFQTPQKAKIPSTILTERLSYDSYRPKRSSLQLPHQQIPHNFIALKKFEEHFRKTRPSFFREFHNIFKDSSAVPEQEQVHNHRLLIPHRGRSWYRKSPEPSREGAVTKSNFTIQSINIKEICRKAKLNKLIECRDIINGDFGEESGRAMRESEQLMRELKQGLRHCKFRKNSFRMSRTSEGGMGSTLLQHLNSSGSSRFTVLDLRETLGQLHRVVIRVSPHVSYFNVYIEEGNNSELLKALVRKRTGWRVVELPSVANLIWTQFHRRQVLEGRLSRREKSQSCEEDKSSSAWGRATRRYGEEKDRDPKVFGAQVRKLVTREEAEDLSKFRAVRPKMLRDISVSLNLLVHNHFPQNRCITDKKNLLALLTSYYRGQGREIFGCLPESYEVSSLGDALVTRMRESQGWSEGECWLVKPGQNSNRGRGIAVCHSPQEAVAEVEKRLAEVVGERDREKPKGKERKRRSMGPVVIQRYILPLLYNGRKFDIRSYMLVTLINNRLRVYSYEECYIRTCSRPFELLSPDKFVHLTNDAIQSQAPDYGKFQEGNKLQECQMQKYMDQLYQLQHPQQTSIWSSLRKQMDKTYGDVIQASEQKLTEGCLTNLTKDSVDAESEDRNENFYFELFGMDFMVDQNFRLWLIEVNTNPSITHDCSRVLNRLIPRMLDNLLVIAVEPIMLPLRVPEIPCNNQFVAIYSKQFTK